MLVFYKQRLVILAVPKTGTTAYQTALGPYADMVVRDPPMLKHAPVYRYNRFFRPMFEKVCGTEMDLLAVMRDPVSWLGSWYRYRQRPFLDGSPKSTQGVDFDAFVTAYTQAERPAFADVGSQARFLKQPANGPAVRYLFRYEDQTGLKRFLTERLEISFELARENVSPQAEISLSERPLQRLRRGCAADFALYESISGGSAN